MQWFYNMKIGKKLILSFILIAGVAAFIGWAGYSGIGKVKDSQDVMYTDKLVPISDLGSMHVALLTMRLTIYKTLVFKDPVQREKFIEQIDNSAGIVDKIIENYSKKQLGKEEQELLGKLQNSWKRYKELKDQAVASFRKSDDASVLTMVSGEFGKMGAETDQNLNNLRDMNVKAAEELAKTSEKAAASTQGMMMIFLALGVILAIFLGSFIARIIGKPISVLVAAADKLALGDVNVKVEATTTDEIGELSHAFEKMVDNIRDNAANAAEIAKGNLSVEIEAKSANDVLAKSMQQMTETLKNLVSEAQMLTNASLEGKLDVRGNTEKFKGGYREIIKGVNDTLDAVIGPLNVAAEYIDRISKGDIPPKITDAYKGDFNEIKNNLNQCTEAIHMLVVDAGTLSKAAVEGKLDARADASKHQGDFRKIVQGVNDTLDAVIGPLNVAAEYIDRISKGDIPPKVTDAYKGDFNEIKNNLNQCIEAINIVVVDAGTLSKAAVEGKLDARADATKHQGDFRKIVQGVNDTLDAVIGPLNVAAEYIDRISKGDIPPKVTDTYKGDFNEIKNNLNACIDGLGGLVESNVVLQKMDNNDYTVAVKGQYQGVFADVATAVNGVQERVKHVIETVTKVSKGDLSDLEAYRAIGNGRGRRSDNDELVPSMIKMMENLKTTISDIDMLAQSSLDGKLDVRADVSKHQGDFRKIVQGVNGTLDAVIGPLNVAAEYIDRISKGDIPPKVTETYKGDFNEIKNNLNACIDGLGGLVEANAVLQRMADNDYSVQVSGQYAGIFSNVADAVNLVQTRVNHTIDILHNISRGDMKDLESLKQVGNGKGKRSENDRLIPTTIRMMESLKATIADIDLLAQSSLEGRLATRADASKHEGDYQKIVEGVNNTLDALVAPVNETVECIERMAEGDLTVQVTGDYKGDLAKMKDALNATLEALNDILGQVNTAADQVVSGSQQVSDAAQSLSQGATEQASSLEEITASMTEMNSQTKQNAENAQQANKLAAAARDNAQTGNDRMREMLGAMKEINDSSGQISRIIKVIDEIAFQTNLLALNAAVEAARAGVHGKGFAVVADEVRNLAQRSAKAAKETTELIENSIKKVENGTGIANETAKALNEIVSGVTKVTDLVGEIASASNEQAQGIAQVNQGLGQVDQVTQANTANAEESAAAAEELSGQATNLQHMITRFQLANLGGMRSGAYGPEQYVRHAPEQKTNGGNGKNKVKSGSMMGLEGKKPAQRKVSGSAKTALPAPSDFIALDDDEFGKY